MMLIRTLKDWWQSKRRFISPALLATSLAVAACNSGANGQSSPRPDIVSSGDGIVYNRTTGKKLDFCDVPPGVKTRSVAIVFIHGGGFRTGDRSQMKNFCELFAKGGFHSITIDYRLSGEATYPAAVDDVNSAMGWLAQKASAEGFDSNKIALVGYSAGGSLSLMANGSGATKPAARVSVAGISDFEAAIAETPLPQLRKDLLDLFGNADPASGSPIHDVSQTYAPTFFFHGKNDALVPIIQSVRMAKKLDEAGAKQLLRVYENAGHEIMLMGPNLEPLLTDLTAFLVALDER